MHKMRFVDIDVLINGIAKTKKTQYISYIGVHIFLGHSCTYVSCINSISFFNFGKSPKPKRFKYVIGFWEMFVIYQ